MGRIADLDHLLVDEPLQSIPVIRRLIQDIVHLLQGGRIVSTPAMTLMSYPRHDTDQDMQHSLAQTISVKDTVVSDS